MYADFLASFEDDEPATPYQQPSVTPAFNPKPFVRGKSFVPSCKSTKILVGDAYLLFHSFR